MAMMARMRSLAPWFILGVGGLFVLFMVLSDSKIGDMISQRSNNIGSVNGEDISYQEFSQLLEQYRQLQQQQGTAEISESQMSFLRDNVWNSLVSQKLIQEKIDEFGIVVTDEEVRDALLGPNPPQSVKQYFIDSTGNFNRSAYEAAIFNPQMKQAVVQLEEQVRAQLMQTKLQDQLNASAMVSEEEIKQKFVNENIFMDAQYILVGWNTITDSLIKASDEEIAEYFDQNKEDYVLNPSRKVKYVLFRKVASYDDSVGIRNNLTAIMNDLKNDTSSFKTYVEIYSQQPYSLDTLQVLQIPREAQNIVANSSKGQIIGPVLTNDSYTVYRMVDVLNSFDQIVRASHILIPVNPENPDDNSKAMEIYKRVLGGEDFATVAAEESQDPGSAVNGGDLGWFAKGQMVSEFESAAFNGKVGEILKPVKSQFGWHIIKVTGKNDKKYVLEKIVSKIEPSATTIDKIYETANDFQYLADKDGFEKVASELGYDVVETTAFEENTQSVPGLGTSQALVVFTFENGLGDISPVFRLPSGYAVTVISDIQKGGYKPIDDVRAVITNQVVKEKKRQRAFEIAKQIRAEIKSPAEMEAAKSVYDKARVGSVQNFTPTGIVPTLGKEYAFSQIATTIELNTLSDAFLGERGAYIIDVTRKTDFDSTSYSLQRTTLRDNLLKQKKNKIFGEWLQKLREEANIEDKRYMFYQ